MMKNITINITKICAGMISFLALFGIGFGAAQSLILNSQSRSTRRSVPFPSFAGIGLSLPPNLSGFPELSSYPVNPLSAIELDIFQDPAPLPQARDVRDSVPLSPPLETSRSVPPNLSIPLLNSFSSLLRMGPNIFQGPAPVRQPQDNRDLVAPISLTETAPGSLSGPAPVRQPQGRRTPGLHWTAAEIRIVVEAILDPNELETPNRQLARRLAQSLPNHTVGTIRNLIDFIKKILAENPELLASLNDPALQESAIRTLWQKVKDMRAQQHKARVTKKLDALKANVPDTVLSEEP